MRALAVYPGERAVRIVERDPPALERPTQARLRVLEVGVCGTDREICRFELGTPPAGADHLILGHECLAEVVEVGPDGRGLAPGDLVVPAVRRPCPHESCAPCRGGRQDFCRTGDFVEHGISGRHGFLVEQVVEEARWLHRVPPALREMAVLVEPLTVVEKALAQLRAVQLRSESDAGRQAVVTGAGPVGLLSALVLASAGFATHVWSLEPASDPRGSLLAAAGVTWVSAEEAPLDALARRLGNIDVLFEASGAPSAALHALAALGHNGVLVLFGLPGGRRPFEIDAAALVRTMVLRNQAVIGTINASAADFAAATRDLDAIEARWPGVLRRLISGRHPLDAFGQVLHGLPHGIKHVLALT